MRLNSDSSREALFAARRALDAVTTAYRNVTSVHVMATAGVGANISTHTVWTKGYIADALDDVQRAVEALSGISDHLRNAFEPVAADPPADEVADAA